MKNILFKYIFLLKTNEYKLITDLFQFKAIGIKGIFVSIFDINSQSVNQEPCLNIFLQKNLIQGLWKLMEIFIVPIGFHGLQKHGEVFLLQGIPHLKLSKPWKRRRQSKAGLPLPLPSIPWCQCQFAFFLLGWQRC